MVSAKRFSDPLRIGRKIAEGNLEANKGIPLASTRIFLQLKNLYWQHRFLLKKKILSVELIILPLKRW